MKPICQIFLSLFFVVTLHSSCNTDKLKDLNVDPNANSEIDWNYLFTRGVLLEASRQEALSPLFLTQQISHINRKYDYWDKYIKDEGIGGSYFRYCYPQELKFFAEVIRRTKPGGTDPHMVNLYNATRVMNVFTFHRCTDLYGDIPYFEACKAHEESLFFPKYDNQRDIYLHMLNELSEAAIGYENNADTFCKDGVQDIIYHGDLDKWRKFTYSLMLRLAMRISIVEPDIAQLYVTEAIDGGVFKSNIDNAWVQMEYTGWWENENKISGKFQSIGEDPKLSEFLVDFLRINNDPRLMILTSGIGSIYEEKNDDPSQQKGLPNGKDAALLREYEGVTEDVDLDLTYSRVNELLIDLDDPMLFHTYAEVEFLLAEAALKGWYSGDPENHYNNGVRAAMQMYDIYDPSLTVSDAEVDAYLATHPYDSDRAMEMIHTQYWIATFLNGYESYANWRRTEIPNLEPINFPGNQTGGTIPRRMVLDQSVTSINEANYREAMERMGGNELTTRVWWDRGN
jgi:hypothetical protein